MYIENNRGERAAYMFLRANDHTQGAEMMGEIMANTEYGYTMQANICEKVLHTVLELQEHHDQAQTMFTTTVPIGTPRSAPGQFGA